MRLKREEMRFKRRMDARSRSYVPPKWGERQGELEGEMA